MLKFKRLIIGFIVLLSIINILSGCNFSPNSLSYRIEKKTGIMYISGFGEMKDEKVINKWKKSSFLPDKIVIGSGITSIADRAFANYEEDEVHTTQYDKPLCFGEVKEVVLPDTIKSIGTEAFENCKKLKKINLPKGLETISPRAFYGCKILDDIIIPASLSHISNEAFEHCKLNNVKIEKGVKSIGSGAFTCCELKNVKLPDSVTEFKNSFCFSDVEEIVLSNNITEISEGAFYGCNDLIRIDLPDNVISIGTESFSSCEKLKEVSFSKKIETIEEEAFYDDVNLENIELFEKIKFIKARAFYNCKKLKTITVPKSVKEIGSYAIGYEESKKITPKKTKDFIIKGYKGTAAEKYAKKNGFKFVALG